MNIYESIANNFEVGKSTAYQWEKTKPKLFNALKQCILNNYEIKNNSNNGIQINGHNHGHITVNGNDISDEIIEAMEKLPKKKKLMYYHKILGDVMEYEDE